MRLDKYLSNMGIGTRAEVKKMIGRGLVKVNDQVIKKVGHTIQEGQDQVAVNGDLINYQKHLYLMLNKPQGVVSATEDNLHETVIDLVKESYGNRKLFPVGRLDKDTEGMLLITDDGDFNHRLMSPKKHVVKTYFAHVLGHVDDETVAQFKKGIVLEDGSLCKPGILTCLRREGEYSLVELAITEGKFHQVKRMFRAVTMEVTYLKRIAIGKLDLDEGLGLGEYRELTASEMDLLFSV